MLLQNDRVIAHLITQDDDGTKLVYEVHVNDSFHRNIFKCVAHLTGRANTSDTAFNGSTISVTGAY